MGSVYQSPGVYPRIQDLSYFIAGLSTTRAGIITTASRGPVNVPTFISNPQSLMTVFGEPSDKYPGLYSALQYLNRGQFLFINRVGNFTKTGSLIGTEIFDQNASVSINNQGNVTPTLTVYAKYPGVDYNGMNVVVTTGASTGTVTIVVEFNGQAVERFEDLSVDADSARYIEYVINNTASIEVSGYIYVDYLAGDNGLPKTGTYTLSGGADGLTGLSDADYIGAITSSTYNGRPSGVQVFRDKEAFDISMMACPGISSAAVINAAGAVMDYRDQGIYIIDPPQGLDSQAVVDWHNGAGVYNTHQAFNSKRFAIYWPWLEVYDQFTRQNIWLPPSGFAMAQWAFTDQNYEPWFAPAGLVRGHLTTPLRAEFIPDQGMRDLMQGNMNCINPIRTFLTQGLNIWGQKTALRVNSSSQSITVVRLTDFVKESISAAAQSLVFEPNDMLLWNQFVNLTEPFMRSVMSRRGIEDFRIQADFTTTSSQDRNNKQMRAKVMFVPVQPAEKIIIDFALFASGANFNV